ncbi:RagB/SusD family nutrient uptake outer membrane protein [Prolixibacter denitrificans]|uniref:Membrane protein n=1 Tax=Prolixibacter denitrificans TaxID=1541063 RepID=A0A2P8CAE8_9BACT|nr:RagB/SusD family nutrient uptake outer membrane protein [Prolixibacter denitrificans]PSK81940.1 putative outer membrane starch-binding protein [Prolixibacter denitrificans]GET22537.1 membrane protein [Prolixibacter denitrificans]
MKKYIILILVTFMSVACSKDFLEKAPLDSINTANFFQTKEDAITAINGAYQPLQWPKLYNMRMWTTDIMAGNSIVGAGGGTDGIETQDEANFVTTTDNPGVLDLWRGPAPGILRCNIILQKVPDMNIDKDLKNRIIGEAKFLRGLYYFILVRFFGDVPLITVPQEPGDDLRPKRTDKAKVYEQIIADLTDAEQLLPPRSEYSGNDIGRASKGAAAGLLAKVYLTLGQWDKVVTLANEVESLGYALNPNYADNFDVNNKNSVESLFEIQYTGNAGEGFWDNTNQASWLSTFTGPRNSNMVAGGWGWNQPTQEFVDSYEPGDLRKDVTILYDGCPQFDGMDYDPGYSTTGYNLRKFLVPKSIASSYDNSPMDFPVLRYADVLLMKAEALNNLGKTTEAEAPLNEVRARAGLPAVTGLSQADFKAKVLHERRMELAFEGQRWFDLIRVDNGDYGLNFLHSIGKVNATSKFLLLPIPQKEIDANPNLTQNPGY